MTHQYKLEYKIYELCKDCLTHNFCPFCTNILQNSLCSTCKFSINNFQLSFYINDQQYIMDDILIPPSPKMPQGISDPDNIYATDFIPESDIDNLTLVNLLNSFAKFIIFQ